MKCPDCTYKFTCPRASEEIKECNDYKKIGLNVPVERIEK